jgi:hypothetical protein
MKRIGSVGILALAVILFVGFAQAQDEVLLKSAPRPRGATAPAVKPVAPADSTQTTPTPELPTDLNSILSVGQTSDMTVAGMPNATDDLAKAFHLVVHFLQLSDDQALALRNLLQQRQQAIGPLLQMIMEKEAQIRSLLETGGSAEQIGQLVIEIHQLRKLIQQAQENFLAAFVDLLNPEQEQRWHAVQLAERLQPIIPAFKILHLI